MWLPRPSQRKPGTSAVVGGGTGGGTGGGRVHGRVSTSIPILLRMTRDRTLPTTQPHRSATPPSHTAQPHRSATPPSHTAQPHRPATTLPPLSSAPPPLSGQAKVPPSGVPVWNTSWKQGRYMCKSVHSHIYSTDVLWRKTRSIWMKAYNPIIGDANSNTTPRGKPRGLVRDPDQKFNADVLLREYFQRSW